MRKNGVKKKMLKEEKKRKNNEKGKKEAEWNASKYTFCFFLLSDDKFSVIFWFLQIIFCFSDFKRWQHCFEYIKNREHYIFNSSEESCYFYYQTYDEGRRCSSYTVILPNNNTKKM
jgi:hypothetical protein